MSLVGNLTVNLRADTAVFDSKMHRSGRNIRNFSRSSQLASAAVRRLGYMLGGAGLGYALKGIITNAAAAEETVSKFKIVFKEQGKEAEAFAKSLSRSIGRSVYDTMKFMAEFQDIFVPLGFGREQAAALSKQITQLGYDLASFNDVAPEDVMQNLISGMMGMSRAVLKYGVNLKMEAVNAEIANMKREDMVGLTTEQVRMTARLNILMRQSADAQGDAVRTIDSLTNSYRRFISAKKDLGVELTRGTGVIATVLSHYAKEMEVLIETLQIYKEIEDERKQQAANAREDYMKTRIAYESLMSDMVRFQKKFAEEAGVLETDDDPGGWYSAAQKRLEILRQEMRAKKQTHELWKKETEQAVIQTSLLQKLNLFGEGLESLFGESLADRIGKHRTGMDALTGRMKSGLGKGADDKGGGQFLNDYWREAVSGALAGGSPAKDTAKNTQRTATATEIMAERLSSITEIMAERSSSMQTGLRFGV